MKLALEKLVDAKRMLMRDGDQYVIMNFAMIKDSENNEEEKSKEEQEKRVFRKEVNIQIMFQLL